MKSQGFSEQDALGLIDHRAILIARKAMLYDESQVKTKAMKKKLVKVPKILKSGTTKSQDQVDQEKLAQVKKRLRETGSIDDAFKVLQARRG